MTKAQEELRKFQEELGQAGVMPLNTTPEQEDKLQLLVWKTWQEEIHKAQLKEAGLRG